MTVFTSIAALVTNRTNEYFSVDDTCLLAVLFMVHWLEYLDTLIATILTDDIDEKEQDLFGEIDYTAV